MEETTGRSFTISPKNKVTLELALLASILVTAIYGTVYITRAVDKQDHHDVILAKLVSQIEKMQTTDQEIMLAIERLKK